MSDDRSSTAGDLHDGSVTLRPATMADMWPVLDWRNREHVRANMYTDHRIEPWEHQTWYRDAIGDPAREILIISSEGADIGTVIISEIDRHTRSCSWAFYIGAAELTGRGIGSAVERMTLAHVFGTLKLDTLRCEVLEFNLPVIGLHRKFGFRETGRTENRVTRNGQPAAAICLELDRDTWEGGARIAGQAS
jgi:UDP-4-amino-4,6-dideoxy-N-acetyl-beta-L-altrosamine N-acetyltransferase